MDFLRSRLLGQVVKRLVDCNLTEVLCFYLTWRGSYSNTGFLIYVAWMFTKLYGERGFFWFLYVTMAGMTIGVPCGHEAWRNDHLKTAVECVLDLLLGLQTKIFGIDIQDLANNFEKAKCSLSVS